MLLQKHRIPGRTILFQSFLLLLGLALNACTEDPSNAGRDVPFDEQSTSVPEPYEASFVFSKLQFGTVHEGLNVDDEYTQCTDGTCIPDGNNGVDNRFDELFDFIKNMTLEECDANGNLADEIPRISIHGISGYLF